MNDQLGLFDRHDDETGDLDLTELRAALARTAADAPPTRRSAPRRHERAARLVAVARRRRRVRSSLIAVLVLALIAAGIVVGFRIWRTDSTAVADYSGQGTGDVVVRIYPSDTLTDIANTLVTSNVVASTTAFLDAAASNADIKKISTGYYRVKMHLSGATAVTQLTTKGSRVGQLRIIPGRQLADVSTRTGGGGAVTPGYITAITQAACVPMNGVSDCFTAAQLWQAEESADPGELGVVTWALAAVRKAPDPRKRLEGMLAPGDYDIPPGSGPVQALKAAFTASAAAWNSTGIVAGARAIKRDPYQVAIVASLVEREGIAADMPKVAQVTYNRLAARMKLQFDSTVNYALDRAQISTTAADRANRSPYNTYTAAALPPTPISSPGADAIDAALNPEDGAWRYFVKVDLKGDSCFSVTLAQHNVCVAKARAAGVFGG